MAVVGTTRDFMTSYEAFQRKMFPRCIAMAGSLARLRSYITFGWADHFGRDSKLAIGSCVSVPKNCGEITSQSACGDEADFCGSAVTVWDSNQRQGIVLTNCTTSPAVESTNSP
jgi:hypothetical protein